MRHRQPTVSSAFECFFVALVDLIGLDLGIAALFDKTAKKVLPILGLIFDIGRLLFVGALIWLGMKS
jgi:hypothetical protein